MHRSITLLFAAALALAPLIAAAQVAQGDHMIVPGVRIGQAELAPADQGALTRVLGAPNRTERVGGMDYYRYGPDDNTDELVVAFDLAQDQPFEISTTSPLYRTQEGLGVGSSEAALRAGLGPPLCQGGEGTSEKVVAYGSIWFLLLRGIVTKVSIRAHLTAGELGAITCKPL